MAEFRLRCIVPDTRQQCRTGLLHPLPEKIRIHIPQHQPKTLSPAAAIARLANRYQVREFRSPRRILLEIARNRVEHRHRNDTLLPVGDINSGRRAVAAEIDRSKKQPGRQFIRDADLIACADAQSTISEQPLNLRLAPAIDTLMCRHKKGVVLPQQRWQT